MGKSVKKKKKKNTAPLRFIVGKAGPRLVEMARLSPREASVSMCHAGN